MSRKQEQGGAPFQYAESLLAVLEVIKSMTRLRHL